MVFRTIGIYVITSAFFLRFFTFFQIAVFRTFSRTMIQIIASFSVFNISQGSVATL